ncbi:MAG: tetratricopeptide repeat protein [Spirochaetes bacterium]|nr:tetratricopeptide repeat protein [Spirochaetota bacterium]
MPAFFLAALDAQAQGSTMPGSEILKLTSSGRHDEARTRGLARVTGVKDDIDAYVALSWSLVALKKYSEAESWAFKGYSLRKDPRLAQAIGEASFYLGKNEVALQMLCEYIASYPEGQRAGLSFYLCGELYLRSALYMHADIALSTAVTHSPSNPLWWTRLGWARENAKKYLQALSAYESALALSPNFVDALEGRKRIQDRMRE